MLFPAAHTKRRRKGKERRKEGRWGGGSAGQELGEGAAEVGEKLEGHSSTPPSGHTRNSTADLAQWRPVFTGEQWSRRGDSDNAKNRKPRGKCSEAERL